MGSKEQIVCLLICAKVRLLKLLESVQQPFAEQLLFN